MRRFFSPITIGILVILFVMYQRVAWSNPLDWIVNELLMLPGIIIGLSFHEYAHAIAAYKCGDQTPKLQGRLTVNPAAHIDPIGFLALLFVGFGWGKAVEINPYNFKHRRRDELIVSFAGVAMNLVIAIIFAVIYKFYIDEGSITFINSTSGHYIGTIIFYVIFMNVVLMIFNLLPVPPLDGFGIVTEIFDLRRQPWYWTVYNNGFFILMLLILFNVTDKILNPIISSIMNILLSF